MGDIRMTKYKITCRCLECGTKYHFHAASPNVPDEPCPSCRKANPVRGLDVAAGKAPNVGGNLAVKAMDIAADIAMEDHGLTDLKSDGRVGATMAPPIRADLQQAADAMFSGKGYGGRVSPIQRRMNQMAALARAKGGLNELGKLQPQGVPDPIAVVQAPRTRPNVTLLNPRNKDGSIIT
jgi:hypothetical protein